MLNEKCHFLELWSWQYTQMQMNNIILFPVHIFQFGGYEKAPGPNEEC